MRGKYRITTLGCKVNQYESQQLRQVLEHAGWQPAGPCEQADLAVVNTCAVTATALRRSAQYVRREARGGRTAVIVVGCGAAADSRRFRDIQGVCTVVGHDVDVPAALQLVLDQDSQPTGRPDNFTETPAGSTVEPAPAVRYDESMMPAVPAFLPDTASADARSTFRQIMLPDLPLVKQTESLTARIEQFDGHERAFLKIQDGCDAYCTYCIIPRLRPTLRSKPVEVAVAEARQLVESGHVEIILTGIFLGAYGRDTAIRRRFNRGRSPLADLVDAVARVEGLERLRLSSLEPGDVHDALLDVLALHQNCVPHLHLPLQSGSAEVLRRMNRQYTRDDYVAMIERVRQVLDTPAISTDIIVGFPGETDADMDASVEVARFAEFCKIHAFAFSPRAGTAAARWARQFVPPKLAQERMSYLAQVEAETSLAYRRRLVGRLERVLVEDQPAHGRGSRTPSRLHYGRADRYFTVHFEADDARPGDFVHVRIERVSPNRTHGTLVAPERNLLPVESLLASLQA